MDKLSVDDFTECCQKTTATTPENMAEITERFESVRFELVHSLAHLVGMCDRIDDLKKFIFYGKDLPAGVTRPIPPDNADINLRLLHAGMGFFTEAAEFVEQVIRDGKDEVNLGEECFDLEWYASEAYAELGISRHQMWLTGIQKLFKRYGHSFNEEGAINRDLEAERKILEEGIE